MRRNSSVGIALGYGLDDRGYRVRFLGGGAGNFSLHHRVQNGSGAHPGSYPMGTRGSRPGCESGHSPPSSAEIKDRVELYLHSPKTSSWRCAQLKKSLNLYRHSPNGLFPSGWSTKILYAFLISSCMLYISHL
jgi:hypothetical protein